MTSLIRIPFAESGDKTAVPETDAGGGVNMTQGYGQAYALDPATDPSAKRIEREKMNGLFNLITSAIAEIQAAGCVPFITADDNNGTAYSYGKGALTILDGVVYQSLEDANTTTPPGAKWSVVLNASNGLSRQHPFADIKSDGASAVSEALSNLGLGSAATKNVGTGSGQIPDMSSFSSGGSSSAKYTKLPDGTVMQRGTSVVSFGGATITLPTAMPSSSYVILCLDLDGTVGSGQVLAGSPLSPTTMHLHGINWNNGTTNDGSPGSMCWMAISL